jgi:hypothetical protein
MGIKVSEVGDWLRQHAGKRDHRDLLSDDSYVVVRPGPNFHWLMGLIDKPADAQTQSPPASDDASTEVVSADRLVR